MIKACVFDLDGTLLDTIPSISYFGNKALTHFGFDKIEPDRYKYLAGNGARVLVERMLGEVGADIEKNFDKVYKYYIEEYDNDPSYNTKPFDGIVELLTFLKEHNIRSYVLSNKPDTAAKAAIDTCLGSLVTKTYGGRDGIELKPSTMGLELLTKEAGLTPDECLYIGDTSVDMKTGTAMGMFTIGVLWGFREKDELVKNGADLIVSHPVEISDYICANNID